MTITDSIMIYKKACRDGRQFFQSQQGTNLKNQQKNSYASYIPTAIDLEIQYMQLIEITFYELITKRNSKLLSFLCSINNIHFEAEHFIIEYQTYDFKGTNYDLMAIIEGLNTAFSKNLDECSKIYEEKYKKEIFQDKPFPKDLDYVSALTESLRMLDKNMGRILSPSVPAAQEAGEKPVQAAFGMYDPDLSADDRLNQFAENRKAADSVLIDQIKRLQVSLQDELKQIMSIREDIDYNIMQEAASQFISLFFLVSDALQYHPNDKNKDGYADLIESCEDFIENIKQSLAMLGVTIINDAGRLFVPEKHKTAKGIQPVRQAVIAKVIKIGFSYKNKVIEKAEVELA